MKSLFAGIVLILVVGLAGFLYRNIEERTGGSSQPVACTMEAKLCPDGSGVGRSGPDCAFAPCAFPNVEFANVKAAFALPAGYSAGVQEPGADGLVPDMLDFWQKPAAAGAFHYITAYEYAIPEGKTGNDVIIAHTEFSPSGEPAKDLSKFKPVIVNGKTFQSVVTERFEGQVASSYYLVRDTDVLRFDILEKDVDWTNPDLVVGSLPEHKALLGMLATLQAQ